ncbi:MAG: discoidin domain-containing protein, partial [Ginsengibacter sp.]
IIKSKNGKRPKVILDNNYESYWTTKGKDTSAIIELKLLNTSAFNVLMLQENISVGQRIEEFELEYWNGNKWEIGAKGTTVGYKRLLPFPTVTTDKVRIKIISSRLNPTISELGLYYQNK